MILVCSCLAALGAEPPIMGWSSWNTYRVNISDTLIMKQADALVKSGLMDAGYRYVNIDDGYFGGRDSVTGRLIFHPQRFPHGLKPVVEHIHSLGLKAGIYSDAGENTCGNFWDKDTLGRNVGLYGHEETDCRMLFDELGFDFIKVDFCGGDAKQNSTGLSLDPEERYRSIRSSIDRYGRKDVTMNVCRWAYPGTWVREVASSWRTTGDISSSWRSVKGIIAENLYLSAYACAGHYNDMDMLEVGRGMSDEEDRTHIAMWCMMRSPLLIGCDLTTLRPETLELLTNADLIALNQDTAGEQAYVAERTNGGYILTRDVERRGGLSRAVAMYNPTDSAVTMSVCPRDIELGGSISARDLTMQQDMGYIADSLRATVPAHGTRVFRLTGSERLPRTRYEAETAFIPTYQELVNPIAAGTGYYREDVRCSGGMCATNLGGSGDNRLIWESVECPADGVYAITIRSLSDEPREYSVEVDGEVVRNASTLGTGAPEESVTEITLKRGRHRIAVLNDTAPMPDMDCMYVRWQH